MNTKAKPQEKDWMIKIIHALAAKAKECRNVEAFIFDNKKELEQIAKFTNTTLEEALFLSTVFYLSFLGGGVSLKKLADYCDIHPLIFAPYIDTVLALKQKNLLAKDENYYKNSALLDDLQFVVRPPVIQAFLSGKKYRKERLTINTIEEFLATVNTVLEQKCDHHITPQEAILQLQTLWGENQKLGFIQRLKPYFLSFKEQIVLALMGHKLLNENDDYSLHALLKRVSEGGREQFLLKRAMVYGSSKLIKQKLVAFQKDSFGGDYNVVLDEDGLHAIFGEDKDVFVKKIQSTKISGLIDYKTIQEKKLFFNPDDEKQIFLLQDALMQENYVEICKRLASKNSQEALTVLIYGDPGVGKTELLYQIAKTCERDIVAVDLAACRTMWYGESERLVSQIFTNYKSICEQGKQTKILLINECDGLLGQRLQSITRAVDQTNNTLQNILLQGIEQMSGILICTTNLEGNLDTAFERRFHLKIHLKKPNATTRFKIWGSLLDSVPENFLRQIADEFELTGGEILNVVRKYEMACVLKNAQIEEIYDFCKQEKQMTIERSKIGFNKNT